MKYDIEQIEAIIRDSLQPQDISLVLAQFEWVEGRHTLQVFIEGQDGGTTVKECAIANRKLLELPELIDLLGHSVYLEVSSPGVERPLRGMNDFVRFSGRRVQLKTSSKMFGRRKHLGVVVSADEANLKLDIEGDLVEIPLNNIVKAKLKLSTEELFAGLEPA